MSYSFPLLRKIQMGLCPAEFDTFEMSEREWTVSALNFQLEFAILALLGVSHCIEQEQFYC